MTVLRIANNNGRACRQGHPIGDAPGADERSPPSRRLETRLTESLSAAEARRIAVCEIDVSRPRPAAGKIEGDDRRL